MVVFINGSLGVGKSSVAEDLLWRVPQTALLGGDALCHLHPFEAYDPGRIRALMDIVRFMIQRYQALGFTRFVVDSIFEKRDEVEAMNRLLADVDPQISHFLLRASDPQREARIRRRRRDNYLWEMERSRELQTLLLEEFAGDPGVTVIDTENLTAAEVADAILGQVGKGGTKD